MNARGIFVRRAWRARLAFGLCLIAHNVIAADIPEQTLRYAAQYKNLRAGEIEIRIRHTADGYAVTAVSKPSKLAALFLQSYRNETQFVRRAGRITLHSGREILTGKKNRTHAFQIDTARGRITFHNGKHTTLEPATDLEAAAFPLLLMLRPLAAIGGTRVVEVSGRRARAYRYAPAEATRVQVPAGEFASWKIVRSREDRPQDRVSVWLQDTANPIPLKISVVKKNKTTTLTLLTPPEFTAP